MGHRNNCCLRSDLRLSRKTSAISSDADVVDWNNRVVAAGGTVSTATINAVTDFVTSTKSSGVWDKLKRANLFCGNNLTACLVPLKVGNGNATETNSNFISGDYSESTGLKGDGNTKYIDTGFRPDMGTSGITVTDCHLSIYNRSSVAGQSGFGTDTGSNSQFSMHYPWSDGNFYADMGSVPLARITAASIPAPFGYLIGTRNGTNLKSYRNGLQVGTGTASGGAMPSKNMYVFAHNSTTPTVHCNYFIGGYTIGNGLSAVEATALTSAMEVFQDALSRGVA